MEAKRESEGAIYVQSVAWNGATVKGMAVDHAQLAKGGMLVFHLGDKPVAVA
jgi:putative alpha-1,2-mannosidase